MHKRTMSAVLLFALIAGFAHAQPALSPSQRLELEIRRRYRGQFTSEQFDAFFRLPWTLEQRKRSEQVLGADAIRMATVFVDYSGILAFGDKELETNGKLMLRLLGADFGGFWGALQPRTKSILLENPGTLARVLAILDSFNRSADASRYKKLLASRPDALVFLHRVPMLLDVPEERLPVLLHFLQNVDFAEKHQEALHGLDRFLKTWYNHLLALHATNTEFGAAPALTLWAAPDFFRNISAVFEDDFRWNQEMWGALIGQLGFIHERQIQALDWPMEVREIAALLNRTPGHGLGRRDWLALFIQTSQANGQMLRLLWEMRNDPQQLERVDALLAYLNEQRIPCNVVLNLLKFSKSSRDFCFLVDLSLSNLYYAPDAPAKHPAGRLPPPIFVMSELEPHDDFMRMVYGHEHVLIAYLLNPKRGRMVSERFALALRTDLKDAQYEQSNLRMAIRWVPGGNLANVVIKSVKGYPITGMEVVFAAVDVARGIALVATLGGSEVATQAGTLGAEEAAKKAVETAAAAAEGPVEEAFWQVAMNALQENAGKIIEKVGSSVVQEGVERVIDEYRKAKGGAEIAAKERELLENARFDDTRGRYIESAMHERFGHLPLRDSVSRQRLYNERGGDLMQVRLPDSNPAWFQALDGKAEINSILLVTLGDLR